jgi:hypothetical protein
MTNLNHPLQSLDHSFSRAVGQVVALLVLFAAAQAAVLYWMGQPVICECGFVRLWTGTVLGPENSQQISDWYTPSHVIHGLLFYFALTLLFPRLPVLARFAIAMGIEAAWEIVENSPPVIERYREQALAQGYSGDSILNSVMDLAAAAAGFLVARMAPVTVSVSLVVAAELFTAYMIRDNLTLNIIQLLYPLDFIAQWQMGLH